MGHKFNKVPIIKFMSYLTSHIYLMTHLSIVGITPIYPVLRLSLVPYWYEIGLLIWLSGLLLFELTNPSDKSGLGSIKVLVLLLGMAGVGVHVVAFLFVSKEYWPTLVYCRNQCFALAFLLACVQILDFLSFHHLFGPWAIIIGDLLKDLARFLAVLAIFVFGFSMHIVALNQSFANFTPEDLRSFEKKNRNRGYFSDGKSDRLLCLWNYPFNNLFTLFSYVFVSFLFLLFYVIFGMFSQHPHLSYFQCVLISICVSALNDQKTNQYNCVCSMCFTHLRIKYNYNHKIQQQLHAVKRKPKTEPNLSFDVVMCRAHIHPYPPTRTLPIPSNIRKLDLY